MAQRKQLINKMTKAKEAKAPVKTKPKNAKGTCKKWDFDKEKLAFFASEIDEVKAFFLNKHWTYTQQVVLKTKGWTKWKKEYHREQIQKAQEAYDAEQIAEWVKVKRNIDTGHKALLQSLAQKAIKGNLSVKEQIEMWKYFKLEKGEPTENLAWAINSHPLEDRLAEMGL